MAHIAEVSEEQADQDLRQLYAQIRQEFGFLPHFWQAQGGRPDIVRASLELWRSIYGMVFAIAHMMWGAALGLIVPQPSGSTARVGAA